MAKVSILNFHGIGVPHDSIDPGESRYWIGFDRFREVLDQVKKRKNQGQSIELTFDDGNRSDVEIAVPELRGRGMVAHFFVLTGRCNDPNYLSAEQIHSLANSDMMVGLHGRDHLDWRTLGPAALRAETQDARAELAVMTSQDIASVAIPFGGYNRRVMKKLKSLEFGEIYTSDGGIASDQSRVRHRLSVRNDMPDSFISDFLEADEKLSSQILRGAKSMLKQYVF